MPTHRYSVSMPLADGRTETSVPDEFRAIVEKNGWKPIALVGTTHLIFDVDDDLEYMDSLNVVNKVFPVGSGAIGVPEIYPRRGIDDANQEVSWY
ncbi:hypothetical protein ACFWBG_11460 [Nocardia salmonicida]|uniref:hypothetical protein n=1 Tax=Nocardia salmonicida TaxID=53431 RepID=UPI00366BEEC2